MPVYFVIERQSDKIKIGVSKEVRRRVTQLQTGSPNKLELMGWINSEDDFKKENELHKKYSKEHHLNEWFSINQDDVLNELIRAHGFIPKNDNSFEIIGHDKDGIPEYVGVCKWADFEYYECCPFCGCFCGMHFNDAISMYHCINCDELTDFSEMDLFHEDDEV